MRTSGAFGLAAMVVAFAGCATGAEQRLELRVAQLERQVAALQASQTRPPEEKTASGPPGECERYLDASVPNDTQFPHVVDFELASPGAGTRGADRIVITEVRG